MKKSTTLVAVASLMLIRIRVVFAGGNEYEADNDHHAAYCCFEHPADCSDHFGKDHEYARVYHAMVHKTYSEADAKLIAEEHAVILNGHAAATSAFNDLKKEMENPSPSMSAIKTLSAAIYAGANKAAVAHLAAMKKLGIKPVEAPSA